ncbi:MAG TPA: hypothetical protein DD473_21095 [Planctomycetaceae bacterium]|nr:hypothetical protein [Planctomycetaceae bacterium]
MSRSRRQTAIIAGRWWRRIDQIKRQQLHVQIEGIATLAAMVVRNSARTAQAQSNSGKTTCEKHQASANCRVRIKIVHLPLRHQQRPIEWHVEAPRVESCIGVSMTGSIRQVTEPLVPLSSKHSDNVLTRLDLSKFTRSLA